MDGGAWLAAVHGVAKSRTRLSDFTIAITNEEEGLARVQVFLIRFLLLLDQFIILILRLFKLRFQFEYLLSLGYY